MELDTLGTLIQFAITTVWREVLLEVSGSHDSSAHCLPSPIATIRVFSGLPAKSFTPHLLPPLPLSLPPPWPQLHRVLRPPRGPTRSRLEIYTNVLCNHGGALRKVVCMSRQTLLLTKTLSRTGAPATIVKGGNMKRMSIRTVSWPHSSHSSGTDSRSYSCN